MSRLLLNRPLLWACNPPRLARKASTAVNTKPNVIVLTELYPQFANSEKAAAFKQKKADERKHSEELMHMWRKISYYVGLPLVFVTAVYIYRVEAEHQHHLRAHPLKYQDYDHLNVRNKPLPYGDGYHTFFSHPLVNPDRPEEE